MENETIFYIFGGALTALAVVVSFLGIRSESFPGSRAVFGGITAVFVVLVAGTATFGVAGARDEQAHRQAEEEHAAEEHAAEAEEAAPETAEAGGESPAAPPEGGGGGAPTGPGGTLALAADPEQLLYDTTSLTSKPGTVTIDFTNPSVISHDVAILEGGEEIAKSELIAEGETSVTADLAPGEYEFICTVPGHAEAGMSGTLSVK